MGGGRQLACPSLLRQEGCHHKFMFHWHKVVGDVLVGPEEVRSTGGIKPAAHTE